MQENDCRTAAFLTLLTRSEAFYNAVAAYGPTASRTLAARYLADTRETKIAFRTSLPAVNPAEESDPRLLSLRHFSRHLQQSHDPGMMDPATLRREARHLTEDAVLMLTELWSGCNDPECREILHDLLQRKKAKLVFLMEENEAQLPS